MYIWTLFCNNSDIANAYLNVPSISEPYYLSSTNTLTISNYLSDYTLLSSLPSILSV